VVISTKVDSAVDKIKSFVTLSNKVAGMGVGISRFHNYSFGNVLEIARQRLVTYCYTSLVSIKIGVCALPAIIDGNATRVHRTVGPIAER
jgi:hypothetical protein